MERGQRVLLFETGETGVIIKTNPPPEEEWVLVRYPHETREEWIGDLRVIKNA